jgi:hypothetical protein
MIALPYCTVYGAARTRRSVVTVERFCSSGEQEMFKGGVHGAACAIAAAMAAYNFAAWCFRRDRHLGANAVIYTLATGWEVKQTMRHLRRCSGPPVLTQDAA